MNEKGVLLSHFIQPIASHDRYRNMMRLNVEHVLKYYPTWTHILVQLSPTDKEISLKIDAYKTEERVFIVKTPRLGSLKPKIIVNETALGTIHYVILIEGLEDSFSTLQVMVEPIGCNDKDYGVTAKICVPWARGFERYKNLNHDTKHKIIYVNAPTSIPSGYNTTVNPISLELFLNGNCRYKLSSQFSIAGTSSKIVQEFYHWLPAHLAAVLFIVLRNQIVTFQRAGKILIVKPYAGFFQCKSLYVVTACRVLKKVLSSFKFLPIVDPSNNTWYIGIVIHGTSIILSIVAVFVVWTILTFHGNVLYKIALKLTRISSATSDVLMKVISTLPLTFGFLFVSIAIASCSGIGLILAFLFYFLMISNAYKDYLENWAWDKAKGLFKKVRAKFDEKNTDMSTESSALLEQQEIAQTLDDTNEVVANPKDEVPVSIAFFEGMQNFSYHITMLLQLGIMSGLNFGLSIAWIKSHYHGHHLSEHLPDPFIVPTVATISCLSILLQLDAPQKSSGYRIVAVILYLCVCACVLYCQENIYRLNYLIAFVYLVVTVQEILNRIVKVIIPSRY